MVEMLTSLTILAVSLGEFSETLKLKLPYDPAIPLLSVYTKDFIFDSICGCFIHNIQETESA